MTYVYRDPKRRPLVLETGASPVPKPMRKPEPLPEPVWGGPLGLALALAEIEAWHGHYPLKRQREKGQS
jgi:hypothetical protein